MISGEEREKLFIKELMALLVRHNAELEVDTNSDGWLADTCTLVAFLKPRYKEDGIIGPELSYVEIDLGESI